MGADQVEGSNEWTEEACELPGEGSGRARVREAGGRGPGALNPAEEGLVMEEGSVSL